MYLNYRQLAFDAEGRTETPELELRTLGGDVIGTLPGVSELKLNVKFSEPSEISFDIASVLDGEISNPMYGAVAGHRIVYTKQYGVYLLMNPQTENDGRTDVKHVKGYSIEKTLEGKSFFLEEGTFNFWNPASPTDTILGRVLEIARDWHPGYVSPSLIGRYRTFDQYDDYLLRFIYNQAPEIFRCVFVFDPYQMTISVYDADEERSSLPIYLDFDNLVQSVSVEEISDELVTAMRPYGADGLDIRNVNPIGTNWVYDLSHFIANGDISGALEEKWTSWQKSILNNRTRYDGLVGLRASASARILTEQAALTELKGQLDDLTNQQSVTIQAISMEKTEAGKKSQQEKLDEINKNIEAKKKEIADKEAQIAAIQEESEGDGPTSYKSQILAIVNTLALDKFFTKDEVDILSRYFIEQDMTEETFVATDLDATVSGASYPLGSGRLSVEKAEITKIGMDIGGGKTMYTITGGNAAITGDLSVTADIIRGTIEQSAGGDFVMSLYVGKVTASGKSAASGTMTLVGKMSGLTSDIKEVDEGGIKLNKGTSLQFSVSGGSMYLTANVSEYQKYSVQMELFDHAAKVLNDVATATYEFSVDSANFLFAQEFAPFREELELGKGIYLNLGHGEQITPLVIEFEVEFEDLSHFNLVFSNRFKRHDQVNTLKDMIENGYSSGRNFDAIKHMYNQAAGQSSLASKFMSSSLDAAVNNILAAKDQSVVINGAGIQVGGDSNYQLRIVDNMMAMTDDGWQTAKLAIGRFASPEIGEYWGVNGEVIGGKLLVGNNLLIENENDQGVMQFKVDATGAWLNNATFVLQKDNGGRMILDPRYGLVAGTASLFDTDGTTVIPSFSNSDGSLILDADGLPKNANFFLDARDGNAYFRGAVSATTGAIGGWTIGDQRLYSGANSTYVGLNASKTKDSQYAIWAGAENPANAKFWVKRDGTISATDGVFSGTIYAKNGTFSGTLSAANVSGVLTGTGSDSWLEGCGIRVGRNTSATRGYNFYVDQNGNVYIQGNLTLSSGAITWDDLSNTVVNNIDNKINTAVGELDIPVLPAYIEKTRINEARIESPSIYGGTFYGNEFRVESDTNGDSGFSLFGKWGGRLYHALDITYSAGDTPEVQFSSPSSMEMVFFGGVTFQSRGSVRFNGTVDFRDAKVEGLSTGGGTAVFA